LLEAGLRAYGLISTLIKLRSRHDSDKHQKFVADKGSIENSRALRYHRLGLNTTHERCAYDIAVMAGLCLKRIADGDDIADGKMEGEITRCHRDPETKEILVVEEICVARATMERIIDAALADGIYCLEREPENPLQRLSVNPEFKDQAAKLFLEVLVQLSTQGQAVKVFDKVIIRHDFDDQFRLHRFSNFDSESLQP
jgi:hypothetical protein